jgi:RNA polymerase sigma-70 factor, ECF subfamily
LKLTAAHQRQTDPPAAAVEDWQDIRASLRGEGDAYARLIDRHQQSIAKYMWRFTRDRRQWEELVQDVFVEAYLALRTFRGDAPWMHWLRTIATRVGYRHWRAKARQQAESPLPIQAWDGCARDGVEASTAADAAVVVHATLARLSPRDRLVLTLMYLEECSVAEIARLVGWSQTMVKVQAHRARGRLRKLLEEQEEG